MLALGVYPEVSLKHVFEKKCSVVKTLANNLDPSTAKETSKGPRDTNANYTFAAIADEWRERHLAEKSPSYRARSERILENRIFIPSLATDQRNHRCRRYCRHCELFRHAQSISRTSCVNYLD